MADHIISTRFAVTGVRSNEDVTKALQALYNIFAEGGLGQATFEVGPEVTSLFIKHKESVVPNPAEIDAALRSAGPYALEPGDRGHRFDA